MSNKISFIEGRKALTPVASEDKDKRNKVYKWGVDNLYPQWLNYLFNTNAIHSGIIRSKVHYITSGGLNYKGNDLLKWQRMLSNGNSDFDLNEVVQKLALDYEISNRMIIKGKWSINKSYVEKLEWIDFEEGRKMIDSNDLMVSADWSDMRRTKKIYKPLDLSDRSEREFYIHYEEAPKQSLLSKDKKALSQGIYPNPPYSGGLKAIQTGIAVDTFQLSEITNGFSGGTLVSLNNGEPDTPEDKRETERRFRDASNPESANPTIITYALGKEYKTTIESLNGNDLADRYTNVESGSTKKVLQAHSVTTPILFGYKEEGSLGNATELKIGYQIMKGNYFAGRQKAILSLLNFIGKNCNKLEGEIEFNDVELGFEKEEVEKPQFEKAEHKKKFNEDALLKELSESGTSVDSFNFIASYEMQDSETDYIDTFLKDSFAEITEHQTKILSLIKDGQDFNTIRKTLEVNSSELALDYSKLIKEGCLNKDGGLTNKGSQTVARSDSSQLSVVFTYEERRDAPALVEGGESRPFCTTLLGVRRAYTREEIQLISGRQGYDVFAYKGGWYHNPNTGKNEPSCRHTWVSNIVFK